MDWDYRITKDSIYLIDYPTQFKCKSKIIIIIIIDYSITFDNGYFETTYKWQIFDSLLILSGNSYYNNNIGTDSMVFKRQSFDDKTIIDLKSFGFNPSILEFVTWEFDKENTSKYRWKEYDTTFYNPTKILTFNKNKEYYLKYNIIKTKTDTFSINYFSKDPDLEYYWLDIEKIINHDTINLSYKIKDY